MILKKPYAFFIKNFKLFHLIIFALSAILLYRTSLIYDFLKLYNKTNTRVIGKELTDTLFTPWLYILIGIIIVVNVIIIVILIKKEKPFIYYIFNITLYVLMLLVYIADHSVIASLEKMLVAAKITLAVRDITNIVRLCQTISVIFYFIRATGFDIKKFDFVKDLQGLDISEEDSEEIEVAVELERNVMMRNIRKQIRNAKYYYKENKFIINIAAISFLLISVFLVYLGTNKYDKVYKENRYVHGSGISLGVKETNVITKDYRNNTITDDDKVLVAVRVSVKGTAEFQTARAALEVDGIRYYKVSIDRDSLSDLGNIYNGETLTDEFTDYLLVYQIPKSEMKSTMTFKYVDNIIYKRGSTKYETLNIKLSPKYPEESKQVVSEFKMNDDLSLDDYTINISNYELNDRFENTYNSCVRENECYDFKEIMIRSTLYDTEKTLMKLEGTFESKNSVPDVNSLYKVIEKYATIEYTYNGNTYTETNDFAEVVSTKIKQDNVYYIQVNKDIMNAEKIVISFNMRNNTYKYVLRGEANE